MASWCLYGRSPTDSWLQGVDALRMVPMIQHAIKASPTVNQLLPRQHGELASLFRLLLGCKCESLETTTVYRRQRSNWQFSILFAASCLQGISSKKKEIVQEGLYGNSCPGNFYLETRVQYTLDLILNLQYHMVGFSWVIPDRSGGHLGRTRLVR